MQLTSRGVSWASLALVVLLAIGTGLIGNYQIVSSLEHEYAERSLQYSRELGDNLLTALEQAEQTPLARAELEGRFDRLSHGYSELSDTRLYLFRVNGELVASGDRTAPPAVAAELVAELATGNAREQWRQQASHHRDSYAYAVRARDDGPAAGWALVIERDIAALEDAMHRVHYRVSALLLFAVGLVAGASFLILRRVGLRYERHLEGALAERSAQLESAHQEILHKARLATLGQTASMLAHEIRNPLTSIKFGLAGLLDREGLGERDQERLRITLHEVDHLNELLTDALQYARPVRRSEAPVALKQLLAQVLQLLAPCLEEKSLQLRQAVAPELPPLRVDAGQLEQVLINLLKNAIEASPVGGSIDIRLEPDDGAIAFAIRNGGPPIPPAQQGRLFEPFNTGKPTGTGLGLTLVKRVVEEHGGRVVWSSTEAAGTCFRILLPVSAGS